jgi:rRNA maturation protein Rpf1
MKKLDNDLLDKLIGDIAQRTIQSGEEILTNLSQTERIEYVCRAYTEILSVLIVAAPSNEVQNVCNNICQFLQASVSRNIQLSEAFGFNLNHSSLQEAFEDKQIFITKKVGQA